MELIFQIACGLILAYIIIKLLWWFLLLAVAGAVLLIAGIKELL